MARKFHFDFCKLIVTFVFVRVKCLHGDHFIPEVTDHVV